MGRREITRSQTQTVPTCDACGGEIASYEPMRCFLCREEVGYCCGGRHFFTDRANQLLELHFVVCNRCDAAGNDVQGETFARQLAELVRTADGAAVRLVDTWRAWAAHRRGRDAAAREPPP